MSRYKLERILLLLGPLAFPVFHLVLLVAVSRNPWFNFFVHAFSDLGGPKASDPWVFNNGLIALGFMQCLYSLGLLARARSRGAAFACGLCFTAGVFLALIGVYPSGTKPHAFIAMWFYLQALMAMSALGLALLVEGRRVPGALLLALGLLPLPLGYAVEITVGWPSLAVVEYAGTIFIAGGSLVATLAHWS
ncbi:MAG: DUF998 domain-containing protein [Thermofilum sp.]